MVIPTMLLALAWVFAAAWMTLTWRIACRLNNYGIVDIAWALGFATVVWAYAGLGHGAVSRRALVATLVTAWSLRLGAYLWKRVMSHHPREDGRYQKLRAAWGESTPRKMFWFFQLQGLLIVVLSVSFLLPCLNPYGRLHLMEWVGAALWLIAWAGEAVADAQLNAFRSNPTHQGKVCAVGLWRYSRHPNYFFEWLVWVAYAVVASASPYGWVSLLGPCLMLFFLFRVTGIPATEEQAIRTKGAAYLEYQRTTSPFVPWFPTHDSR